MCLCPGLRWAVTAAFLNSVLRDRRGGRAGECCLLLAVFSGQISNKTRAFNRHMSHVSPPSTFRKVTAARSHRPRRRPRSHRSNGPRNPPSSNPRLHGRHTGARREGSPLVLLISAVTESESRRGSRALARAAVISRFGCHSARRFLLYAYRFNAVAPGSLLAPPPEVTAVSDSASRFRY